MKKVLLILSSIMYVLCLVNMITFGMAGKTNFQLLMGILAIIMRLEVMENKNE